MQHFVYFVVCTFLVVIVHGVIGNVSSQQQCTLRSVCGVLDNIRQRQARLEKKVKAHSAILGGGRCTEGNVRNVESSVRLDSQSENYGLC